MINNVLQCYFDERWMKKKRISEHLHGIFAKSIIKLQGVEEAKNTLGSPCSSNCTIIARCILVIIIYSYYYTQSSLTLVRVKAHMKFSTEEFEIWRHICSFRISTYVCPMCDIFFVSFFINSSVSLSYGMQNIWIEEALGNLRQALNWSCIQLKGISISIEYI